MNIDKFDIAYRQLKRLEQNVEGNSMVGQSIVDNYHEIVDEIAESDDEIIKFKVPSNKAVHANHFREPKYEATLFKTYLSKTLGFLESHLQINEITQQSANNQVTVINQNTIAVNIEHTINQLIGLAKTDEEKTKLSELDEELSKPNKNWDKIKGILVWVLNFSKELFIQILPELLKRLNS